MNYKNRKRHGDSSRNSRIYRIWLNMKNRCNCKKHSSYSDYGGRGIKVCKEWEFDYQAFKTWALDNGYNEKLSIDRIDVNKGYYPENCTWSTLTEQANNTRRNVFITHNAEKHTLAEWARITGIPYATVISRHSRGWSAERILTTEVKKRKPNGSFNANIHYHENKERINARRKELREQNKEEYNRKQREYRARKRVI